LVRRGQLVAEVLDWKGNIREEVTAPFSGIVTIKVNWLPVKAGEWLVAMARMDRQR